jgi:hypothetical protein
MADQHIGYPGSVNAAQLADWMPNVAAAQYSVAGTNDAKAIIGAGTRAVTIKAGTVIGDGILDVFENDTTVNLTSVPSGDRWDMIVLRRTWNATPGASTSIYTVVTGGPNRTLPSRNTNAGVLADQPIALARVRSGQNAVQEIVDLRVWAHNGGVFAVSDLVMGYLDQVGTHLTINGDTWIRKTNGTNSVTWERTAAVGSIGLYSAANALTPGGMSVKSLAESGHPFIMQCGTQVGIADQSGYCRVNWPRPFPNGVLYVAGFNGDDWATGGSMMFASAGNVGGGSGVFGDDGYGSKTSWVYAVLSQPASDDGVGTLQYGRTPYASHRINWIAIGW